MTPATHFPKMTRADLAAGLTVAGLLIPEAVAYSALAGMPAQAGLIALLFGLCTHVLLGNSRFAMVSSTSSSAIVIATALATLVPNGSGQPELKTMAAAALICCTGLIFLSATLLNLGKVADFIAKPVLRGVTIGLSFTIILSQLPTLLGIHPQNPSRLWNIIGQTLQQASLWHLPSLITGLIALFILNKWKSPFLPPSVATIILGIAAVAWGHLDALGVATVGSIRLTDQSLSWAAAESLPYAQILSLSLPLVMLLYAESYSSIRSFALKHNDAVNINRDFLAIGCANLLSGLSGGLAVGAGFSGTSANEAAGAQSKWSGAVAAVLLVTCTAFLLPQIAQIPKPILAAIVIHAVSHNLNPAPVKQYFTWQRDRLLVIFSISSVLLFGVLNGLIIAIVSSMLLTIYRFSQPQWAILGRLDEQHDFVNITRFPEAKQPAAILVTRIDTPLFFANVTPVLKHIHDYLKAHPDLHYLVINMEESPDLDGTCLEELHLFASHLKKENIQVYLARLHSAPLAALTQAAFDTLPSEQLSSLSTDHTVRLLESATATRPN